MIQACSLATGLDYIELSWTHPRFLPESYQLKYMCTLKVTSKYNKKNYIQEKTRKLNSDTSSVRIPDLHPSSICTLILVAVYNPASIDSGITITGTTLDEHSSKRNSGLRDFKRIIVSLFYVYHFLYDATDSMH